MLSGTLFMYAYVQYGSVAKGSDITRPHAWPQKSKQGMLGVEGEAKGSLQWCRPNGVSPWPAERS